jgi:steroid delta-isomerase-like uncharacterized protein
MSVEENKADTRRAIKGFWNQGNMALLDEFWAPNYVNHDPTNPEVRDLEGFKQWVIAARTAFPDLNVTIDDLIAEGDKVVTRWTVRGTHKGEFGKIPATGKQVTFTGITISRFVDGKTVESWWSDDDLGLMQQLGVIPPME